MCRLLVHPPAPPARSTARSSNRASIVVAENIDDYRAAIAKHLRSDDVVLEVGCHQGCSTVLMDNVAQMAVGVDKGAHVLAEARRLHPELVSRFFVTQRCSLYVAPPNRPACLPELTQKLLAPPGCFGQRFESVDAADVSTLRAMADECGGGFSVIFIDIGGGSIGSVCSAWRLIEMYGARLGPRLFVVKAFKWAELIRRCEIIG